MNSEIFEKKLKIVEDFVKKALKSSSACHDYDHTMRVFHNAKRLLECENGADYQIVYVSCLLHDIGRGEEFKGIGKVCHAEIGGEIAKKFLLESGFDDAFTFRVVNAIKCHRFRDEKNLPKTIEDKILYDADKLDSLGPIGIGRSFMFAAKVGAKLHNSELEALNSEEYSIEDTAYREYLVKLSKVPDKMQTESGRFIAQKYVKFMDDFFREMNIQVEGIDYENVKVSRS